MLRREEDGAGRLRLKTYRHGASIALSDAVPVFENFGFGVLEEWPTRLSDGSSIHEFLLESDAEHLPERAPVIERAIAAVLEGQAENDAFNQLLVAVGLAPDALVLLRAWFRYLRQTGLSYGLSTVAEALRKAPDVAQALIVLFRALHDPALRGEREEAVGHASTAIDEGLMLVAAIDRTGPHPAVCAQRGSRAAHQPLRQSGPKRWRFKVDSSCAGTAAPVPCAIWVIRGVEGILCGRGSVAPRRHPMVGPARRLPHRSSEDEGAGGSRFGDVETAPKGLLSEAIAAPQRETWLAKNGGLSFNPALLSVRQSRRGQDRPSRRHGHPRRRRSLFRGSRRQGNGEFFGHRQRPCAGAEFLARRRLRQRWQPGL